MMATPRSTAPARRSTARRDGVSGRMVYRNPYDGYSEEDGTSQEEYGEARDQQGVYYTQQPAQVSTSGWSSDHSGAGQTRGQEGGGTYTRPTPSTSSSAMGTKARGGEVWPRGSDHLFSCWAFTLSLHSLWTLPMMVVQHGGLAFLLIYTTLVMVLGAPLLLLELALGQSPALPPARLFRHLCPLLAGLGLAFTLLATLRGMLDLAVLMWSGQGLFHLFSSQAISEGFLSREVLGQEEATLQELGGLRNQVLLVLGIAALSTFVFLA